MVYARRPSEALRRNELRKFPYIAGRREKSGSYARIPELAALSKWYLVKLELGATDEFPKGSLARAFLLRLPLARDGSIDEPARAASPSAAFVRRFWDNEPDRSGAVLRNSNGWNFAFPDEPPDGHYHLDDGAIRPGGSVDLTAPDGTRLPFRVASIRPG